MPTIETERPLRRFDRDDYHRMMDAGILRPDERVELIEGEIVTTPAMHSPHAACLTTVQDLFYERIFPTARVRVQLPIGLGAYSEPEPDIALVEPRPHRYREAHPTPDDVLLLVEIMDSSRYEDRKRKVPLYAGHGIRELWLVDVVAQTVDVCIEPGGEAFGRIDTAVRGDSLRPTTFPDVEFTIDEILG